MPKTKKVLILPVICFLIVCLLFGLSINWSHTIYISSVGSNGVKPFIEAFSNQYYKTNHKYEVTVEGGGTIYAIDQISKKISNIGNSSINPYYDINANENFKKNWINKKTLTLGWEGLILLYKMPNGLSKEAQERFELVINQNNILNLYAIFSGFNGLKGEKGETKWNSEWGSFWPFLSKENQNYFSEKDAEICKNTQVVPYVRSGGNVGANSAIAFSLNSNLCDINQDLTQDQKNAFAGGQYGKDRLVYQTDESNAKTWNVFSQNNIPGSMVYLTTSFLSNKKNYEIIKKRGYKAVFYNDCETNPIDYEKFNWDDFVEKICNDYNWYRPINIFIDISDKKSIDFIKWIYSSNSFYDTMKKNGARPINDEEYNSMKCSNQNCDIFDLKSSDLELERELDKKTYGALEMWKYINN